MRSDGGWLHLLQPAVTTVLVAARALPLGYHQSGVSDDAPDSSPTVVPSRSSTSSREQQATTSRASHHPHARTAAGRRAYGGVVVRGVRMIEISDY